MEQQLVIPADPLLHATQLGLRPGSQEWQAEVRRVMQRRSELEKYERNAERFRELWDRGRPATPDHPYLVKKGCTSAPGLKTLPCKDGMLLMVPMKGLVDGDPLMNIQWIDPTGRKRFGKQAQAKWVRTTIGAYAFKEPAGMIYVCEGWATGWSIHKATGLPVIVAFSADNLKPVATHFRKKYEEAQIVLAADNDRAGDVNTGVKAAREAAEAAGGLLAIPSFKDMSGDKPPSDFNDLMLREGLDAVRFWLDPQNAPRSATDRFEPPHPTPGPDLKPAPAPGQPAEPIEPAPAPHEPAPERAKTWRDKVPFRCLGHNRGVYYYLPEGAAQIAELTPRTHDRLTLYRLAPLEVWEREFPKKEGADWAGIANSLMTECHRLGVHSPDNVRGRGCWWERREGAPSVVIVHLGDRLLPGDSKHYVLPERYEGQDGYIYERQERLPGPLKPLDLAHAREILALCEDLNWTDDAAGALLAGWIVLSPICGALSWRPHLWITGGSGAGKSTVLEQLVAPLLGGMLVKFDLGTTEAGIRGKLRTDAIPVLYDEADKEDAKSEARIQAIIGLLRSSSSASQGSQTAKGTATGGTISFQIRSMFCLASIGGSLRQEADKARVSVIQMKNKEAMRESDRIAHWAAYQPRLERVTEEMGRDLIARTLQWLRDGRLMATIKTMRSAATAILGTTRNGDQYGTLLAGAWTLMADEPPSQQEARELVASYGLRTYIHEQTPEGIRVMRTILQTEVRMDTSSGAKTFMVGELVDAVMGGTASHQDEARRWLKARGMEVEYSPAVGQQLVLGTGSEWVRDALAGSPYSDSWVNILKTLRGVETGPVRRFHTGLRCSVLSVPRSSWDQTEDEE